MTGALLLVQLAGAGPLPDAEEFIATYEAEPPNIIFLLDLSGDLQEDCGEGERCLDTIVDTLVEMSHRIDWANIGVVGTSPTGLRDFSELAAVGADRDALRRSLEIVDLLPSGDRNLAESMSLLARRYLSLPVAGLYSDETFADGPICASCQDTHIVALTAGLPYGDTSPLAPVPGSSSMDWDVRCDEQGLIESTSPDYRCLYDNLSWYLYNQDFSDLAGQQQVTTHTIYIEPSPSIDPHTLFHSAAYQTDYWGMYRIAYDSERVRASMHELLEWVRWPLFGDSAPLIHADGDRVLYSYYTSQSQNPLHEGHLLAYAVGDDPDQPATLGKISYDGAATRDGALWDAGEELSNRPVHASEYNENDRDGSGRRDLYTFLPQLASRLPVRSTSAEGRIDFDRSLFELVSASPELAELLLPVGEPAGASGWDFDGSGAVDARDLLVLIDFTRGDPSTAYHYLYRHRGSWRLGDTPRAEPAFIRGRNDSYSIEPSYRRFLKLVDQQTTEVVLMPSNSGMLHAFDLSNGSELWGWIPGRLLLADRDSPEEGRLADTIRYGRTRLLEGSVTVEDVWIDADGDGLRSCEGGLEECEWRRVAVVSQGRGGPAVLALDVTDPTSPVFLWEQADPEHPTGQSPQTVTIAPLADGDQIRWSALWGAGPARMPSEGAAASLSEPKLYLGAMDDHVESVFLPGEPLMSSRFSPGGLIWPDAPGADLDGDGRAEESTISSAPAAVDLDSDGDVDVMYLHITDTRSEQRTSTLYKLLLGDDPSNPGWCALYSAASEISAPSEASFSPTISWMEDGSLALFWGSGGAQTGRSTETGHLFGIKDTDPWGCLPPTSICGDDGALSLGEGTRLTDAPIIYAGTVYFSTWSTPADGCGGGEGRIYGISYDACTAAMPDPDEPLVPSARVSYVTVERYPSISLTEQGRLLYASPSAMEPIAALETGDPLQGTAMVSYMVRQ